MTKEQIDALIELIQLTAQTAAQQATQGSASYREVERAEEHLRNVLTEEK